MSERGRRADPAARRRRRPSAGGWTRSTTSSTRARRPRCSSRSTLGQPLLLEGEPGVGKTAAAKALATALGHPLIRLQCYEGLTVGEALYEWNYQRQLLAIRLAESRHEALPDADLFTAEFLQERPILQAIRHTGPQPPVLLIDEIDRADDEFEALLFEFLGEAAITIPEIGTFTADPAAGRRADLQPQPRAARRAAPALPLPLDRLPGPAAGGGDPAPVGAVGERAADRLDHPVRRPGARSWSWTRRRAWPRRSTGCRRCPLLGAGELVRDDVLRTLGTIAKTAGRPRHDHRRARRPRARRSRPGHDRRRRLLPGIDRAAFATALAARLRDRGVPVGLPRRGLRPRAGRRPAGHRGRALLDRPDHAGAPAGRPGRVRRGLRAPSSTSARSGSTRTAGGDARRTVHRRTLHVPVPDQAGADGGRRRAALGDAAAGGRGGRGRRTARSAVPQRLPSDLAGAGRRAVRAS